MKHIVALLFILIVNLACDNSLSQQNRVHFGESFTLDLNETAFISDLIANNGKNVEVCFRRVYFDYRCPKSMCQSCYGSTASICLMLIDRKDTFSIPLTILGCMDEYECNDQLYYRKDTLGYRFSLLRLDPYPDGSQVNPIYSVKINIEKL